MQWVAIFLVIQAMVFYLPRVLWLSVEGGLMKVNSQIFCPQSHFSSLFQFLVRNARGKIIEDAEEKRDALIVTFKVGKNVVPSMSRLTFEAGLHYLCLW